MAGKFTLWKFPVTSSAIQTATFRLVVQCPKQPRYGLFNCTKGKEICLLCSTQYLLPCSHVLPLPTVLLWISAFHIQTSPSLKIHINTFVPSTHFSSKLFLRFSFPPQRLWAYFLCQACHTVSPSRPPYNPVFRPPHHWLIVARNFRNSLLYFKETESSSTFVSFKVRPSLSVQTSITTFRATWLHIKEEWLCYLNRCEKLKTRVTARILVQIE